MAWDSRIAHLLDEDVGGVAGLIRAKQAGDHPPRARHRATLRRLAPVAVVPSDRHGAALGAAARPSARLFARGPDLRWKRDDARDSECQIGHDRIVTWRKIHPSHQMFFSPTVVNPFRKPPRGAHTDARNDAKLSHVQHSSTCKHGPSRDQAGTRRCVPHLAQRPGPFARHLFSRELPTLAGYFPPATRPAARFATRVSAYRLPEGHPRALRTCRIPTVLPCEPSRAPDADPPRRFNVRRPVTHCQLTLRFSSISSPFSRRLWRLAGLGRARHSRRRRRTPRALASLLRQPLQRQPPQLDRRARPSQIHRPPQPRRGRRRHPRSRRSAVAMSGDFTRRTRRCDTARLLPTSARDENERRRGG